MEASDMSAPHDRRVPPENDDDWAVEPLKPKRASRTVRETERLLAALQLAISTDLDVVRREILRRLGAIEISVEVIARELGRRGSEETRGSD